LKDDIRKMLEARLARMSPAERRRLYNRALKLRKRASKSRAVKGAGRRRSNHLSSHDDWEDSPRFEKSKRRSSDSLDAYVLQLLLQDEDIAGAEAVPRDPARTRNGTVVAVTAGACAVRVGGERLDCMLPPDITAVQISAVAVGDSVSFTTEKKEKNAPPRVTEVLPRRTTLSRPDPHIPERERLIAANIDVAVIVVSVKAPPLRVRLIDRYLIATQRGGAKPLICVNKIDLIESAEERTRIDGILEPYRAIGVCTLSASATTGTGIAELQSALGGLRCVVVGRSGVGKSSLLNAMWPDLALRTTAISEWADKGKHTTTSSALYELPGGIEVIDTPGVRQFGLWKITRGELRWYFPEFDAHASACRFQDCSHTNEPACAVKQAVERGEVAPARYDTYLRILPTLEG
jgi:ribosome biogenesis GTPase